MPAAAPPKKETIKSGRVPEDWKPARTRQIDRGSRRNLKPGRKLSRPDDGGLAR